MSCLPKRFLLLRKSCLKQNRTYPVADGRDQEIAPTGIVASQQEINRATANFEDEIELQDCEGIYAKR